MMKISEQPQAADGCARAFFDLLQGKGSTVELAKQDLLNRAERVGATHLASYVVRGFPGRYKAEARAYCVTDSNFYRVCEESYELLSKNGVLIRLTLRGGYVAEFQLVGDKTYGETTGIDVRVLTTSGDKKPPVKAALYLGGIVAEGQPPTPRQKIPNNQVSELAVGRYVQLNPDRWADDGWWFKGVISQVEVFDPADA